MSPRYARVATALEISFRVARIIIVVSRGRRIWCVTILYGAPACALQILKLPGIERPQEGCKPEQAEHQGCGDEPSERCHAWFSFIPMGWSASRFVRRRSAFPVTAIDEADMASAAMSGVTNPAIASGTHSAL